METKTAKITSVQENQGNWNYNGTTHFKHFIKFEGSDTVWTYDSKSDKCEKFKVGETATFEIKTQQNGQYTNYKIKPVSQQNGQFAKGNKDQGVITALSCLSSACNLHQQSSAILDPNSVLTTAEKFYQWATQKSTLKQ